MEQNGSAIRARDLAPYLDLRQPQTILDVANGRLRPQYTILRRAGHRIYGIDYVNRPRHSGVDLAYGAARRIYNWRLGVRPIGDHPPTLICGDVGKLPFPSAFFDLVTSIAAFEHFLDVPAVVGELWRVLRPGGMAWIWIHIFTSPSGGHNLSFTEYPIQTLPPGVDAWDHLRKRRLPFTVPLNEWRIDQYLAEFGRHFEVLHHYTAMREGEAWLTPEITLELAQYTRDELTCGSFVIVARKPAE
jgi:SAM-dependent methyltransferase